ncbi:hypothetical protein HKD37_03G007588 [Glycine soja]
MQNHTPAITHHDERGLHRVQSLTSYANFGFHSPPHLLPCTIVYSFQAVFHVHRNYIEVLRAYHKQWALDYPGYVQIEYNKEWHVIKLRKNGHHCIGNHVEGLPQPFLPTAALDFVDASTRCMTVQHRIGVHGIWSISMHNAIQYVDDPWHGFLMENHLMGGDEVVFYYRPNQHNFMGCTKVDRFQATLDVDKNYIQIPLNYHINRYPKYPTYVVFDVNGDNHFFIRVRRYENKMYFADGIKEFKRQMNIYETVVINFVAPNKNTTFHVFFSTPRYRQPSTRSAATTRRHVFTVDVNEDIMQQNYPLVLPPEAFKYLVAKNKYKRYMNMQRSPGRRCLWKINMQNGVPCVADPWYQYLSDNDLMSEDEVVFYYRFNQHE